MKKLLETILLCTLFTVGAVSSVYADTGSIGFFGGITEGKKLPKTTEILIQEESGKKTNKSSADKFIYKEMLIAGGVPVEFEGYMDIKQSGDVEDDKETGTYTLRYSIAPVANNGSNGEDEVSLKREISFDVSWRREKKQVIKDYKLKSWSEEIKGSASMKLVPALSNFSVSIIEDHTPGVVYYKGNISMQAVYASGEDEGGRTTVQTTGAIYGYNSAWSNTETHRLDTWVYGDGWQTQYQLRPSVSVTKELQYSQNEPTAISFSGNYREVIKNTSALSYNIFAKPVFMYDIKDSGAVNIDTFNDFEQLIAPDTAFLKGHFAEGDIAKLFAMQIVGGEPKHFLPEQAMTRGQYVEALAKSIKLPIIKEEEKKKTKKKETVKIVFPDVMPEREEYPYIMAAYNHGLAIGRDNGNFFIDETIQREEAIVILIRCLGLENLGLDPTPATGFTDDAQISSWAKKEIAAARKLGIISGDENGAFRPHDNISKAEGAALVNRLINYMRKDLVTDYTEHIINYAY